MNFDDEDDEGDECAIGTMEHGKEFDFMDDNNLDKQQEYFIQKTEVIHKLCEETQLDRVELQLIEMYLGKINSHDPQHKLVSFQKKELEELFGVVRVDKKDMVRHMLNLGKPLLLADKNNPGGFATVPLFYGRAVPRDGGWYLEMEATDRAMKYIFNIESMGYFGYLLSSGVTRIRTRRALQLYLYIEKNRFRKKWRESVDNLQDMLWREDVEDPDSFTTRPREHIPFKFFRRDILLKCQAEIHRLTKCRFAMNEIKVGRHVTEIQFEIVDNLSEKITIEMEHIRLEDGNTVLDASAVPEIVNEDGVKPFAPYTVKDALETATPGTLPDNKNNKPSDDSKNTDIAQIIRYSESEYDERYLSYAGACDYEFSNQYMKAIVNELVEYDNVYIPTIENDVNYERMSYMEQLEEKRLYILSKCYEIMSLGAVSKSENSRFHYLCKTIRSYKKINE